VHEEAELRECSVSTVVVAVLYETGITLQA
jgi:hypothetical protein